MEISVIVPIYNVEKYLNQCMESIAGQTYGDFEALMINDGSTDKSEQVCKEWAVRDKRFKLYTKGNEGPSIARNYGIKKAKGKYIAFIDADDWVDRDYLKLLYEKIIAEDADIAECDVYRFNNQTKKKTVKVCWGVCGREYSKEERIERGYTAIWRCLYKKTLWIDNEIEFPDCHGQARGIYALLVALAKKVVCVREPLYYYRKFRENSLSANPRPNEVDHNAEGIQAYKYLIEGFKNHGIFDKYYDVIKQMMYIKASEGLAALFPLRTKTDFRELRANYKKFIKDLFPENRVINYITFGGYNLNQVVRNVNQINDPYLRFNFSSVISLMNPVKDINIVHRNKYRKIMVERDVSALFWDIIKEEKPEYIIIDLMEERFDVLRVNEGYLTKSDALDGLEKTIVGEKISRFSDECEALWKDSCRKFINRLNSFIPSKNVILVKSYLSEKYGDLSNLCSYDSVSNIRETNEVLRGYYDFFEENCTDCKSIEVVNLKGYFTDALYEYGAIPSHLNELVNRDIACLISKKI